MTYISEKYQLGIIVEFLNENKIKFATEQLVYSIPIDIIGYDGTNVISIELKTKDFGRGLAQAERNTAYVDHSYLSVWKSNLTEGLIERVDETSIGLLAIDEDVEVVSTPMKNTPNSYARKKVKNIVESHNEI
ncbi:hypothetical protein [Haladaptatus sp. ZSTT2]|uniref:hypothetical protein n=1 Tax=Haladaptatus sp. ZSTT2 TaxID=3120515 RepID=UPI00300F4408